MDKELLRKKYKKVNENASVNNDAYSFLKNYNNIGYNGGITFTSSSIFN